MIINVHNTGNDLLFFLIFLGLTTSHNNCAGFGEKCIKFENEFKTPHTCCAKYCWFDHGGKRPRVHKPFVHLWTTWTKHIFHTLIANIVNVDKTAKINILLLEFVKFCNFFKSFFLILKKCITCKIFSALEMEISPNQRSLPIRCSLLFGANCIFLLAFDQIFHFFELFFCYMRINLFFLTQRNFFIAIDPTCENFSHA